MLKTYFQSSKIYIKAKQAQKIMANVLSGEQCPVCNENTLELREDDKDIPYFGKVYIMSMTCSNCKFHKSEIETEETKEPCKFTFEVESEDDLNVRVVKSGEATVKIPRIVEITPGPASNGYITNIEGIITRVKDHIETAKESEDDPKAKKKAKNMIKKLNRVIWGREKLKITIEDPSGNSAILSDKATKKKL